MKHGANAAQSCRKRDARPAETLMFPLLECSMSPYHMATLKRTKG